MNHSHRHLFLLSLILLKNCSEAKNDEKPLAKKYRPIWNKEIYSIQTDLGNGSYYVRDLKREKPPFLANVQEFRKLKVRYEVDIHLHDNTISSTKVHTEVPISDDSDNQEDFDDESNDYYEIHQILDHKVDQDGKR